MNQLAIHVQLIIMYFSCIMYHLENNKINFNDYKSPWYVLCKANHLVRRSNIYASSAEPHIQGVSWDFAIMKYSLLSSMSAA